VSVYGMRHSAVVPRGFTFPASIASDSWEDRTVILPAGAVRQAIAAKSRPTFGPAWTYPASAMQRPSESQVREWAGVACAYRSPERKAYARAWLLFCSLGGVEAPRPADFHLAPADARRIQRRFMDLDLFDPRDFAAVPF
jgi:hypothetical protein